MATMQAKTQKNMQITQQLNIIIAVSIFLLPMLKGRIRLDLDWRNDTESFHSKITNKLSVLNYPNYCVFRITYCILNTGYHVPS